MYLNLLVVLTFIGSGAVESYVCTSQYLSKIDPNPYYYPSTWMESQPAPMLDNNQTCDIVFQVPPGYYAKVIISSAIQDNASHFGVVDTANKYYLFVLFFENPYIGWSLDYRINHETQDPWYFSNGQVVIIVNTVSPAAFGLKVTWQQYPSGTPIRSGVGITPLVLNATKDVYSAEFSAVTGLSLTAFPVEPKNYLSLRSTLISEGDSFNGKFVNSLYGLFYSQKQYFSKSTSIYIVNVAASGVADHLLLQESAFVRNIKPYEGLNCPPSSTCTKQLSGGKTSSGLVYVGSQTQTILDIFIDWDATLSVYFGSPTDTNLYNTYNGTTIRSLLPLKYYSGVTQYIVSSGNSMMTFKFAD
ncbi:hypothetical protein CAEBREN_09754 [Caenorhabditis brenneri]|uniref:Uncharacterized protein n=1 Tax=Caenorhabditis brenneri TaxID=135651 RepID=G0N5B2_CAEBE|nr:hypothetical protein CAEBREN_09754 [Caenorhabditis brenneri]